MQRFSRHQAKIDYAQKIIQRRPYLFVVGTRFMYGFRVIGPLLIGASHLPPKIFFTAKYSWRVCLGIVIYYSGLHRW
ncbi:DedA family inner membrane protein YohD [Citrobacter freundii]|uniref:DedA family inner membrane protein YohD n=1 Tax=Citrobacter freundii TaxID=546 RepID=A0A7G2IIU7_CITFR|nr:DedA family inner membrane protein YohD [Citrobacter freundii]